MERSIPESRTALFESIRNSIIAIVLGVVGLLAIMQWTDYKVRQHIRISSQSIFPAALKSQRAGTALDRVNRDYSNAVVMQDKRQLAAAGREAGTVVLSLESARTSMAFNSGRHSQISSLLHRIADLQIRSQIGYAAAIEADGTSPRQEELAYLSHEHEAVETALETLKSDLESDFGAELALIDRLLRIGGLLEAIVLAGVIVALSFSIRSLISATLRGREDEILRKAHSQQETERKMLRALIDNIPDYMYVKDSGSRFVIANAYLASAVGAESPEKMKGKTDFDFYPRELASAFYEDEQSVMLTGQGFYNREEQAGGSAGNEIHILTTKVPLRDSNGQLTGIAGVGRDISARKRAEDALRQAEQNYRGIFDNAIIGIFQKTPEGRFLTVNHSMASTFGYDSPEEMVANITDIPHQFYVDSNRHQELRVAIDELGGVQNFECETLRKDGSKIWNSLSVRAIRENGIVVRYEGMSENITERKLLREQLFQAQKLESVGQLAAGIAHEINTPTQYVGNNVRFLKNTFRNLTTVLDAYGRLWNDICTDTVTSTLRAEIAAILKKSNLDMLLEEIPKAIEDSLEGVKRVSTLVSAMKEFSHPGTKEKIPLDLNHAIQSTITVAQNEWKYVADMETDFESTLPLVSCLPGEFNQVVLNLIVNAAHAIADHIREGGPEKGTIRIQTRNCSEWAEIRIQDTGSGIPEAVRTRIFDPFFTTKEIGKGTGQGLAIARSVVVDKHGGTLSFETEMSKGTTFIIRLPLGDKPPVAKAVAA